MRTFIPIAAVVLLTAGAATLPALTDAQTAKVKHHTWKKANIDTAAMSASMSAGGASLQQPSAPGSNMAPGTEQPGAVAPSTTTPPAAPTPSTDNTMAKPGTAAPATGTTAQPDSAATPPAAASSSSDSSSSAPQ